MGDIGIYPPWLSAEVPVHINLDYSTRTDTQPVYLGKAPEGVAVGTASWTVLKFRYESTGADARMLEFDVRTGISWTNRADPTLNGKTAWGF